MRFGNESTMHNGWRGQIGLFVIAAVFVSFAAGLGLADFFRTYRSVMTIIVLPQERPVSTREIAENIMLLSKTMAYRSEFFSAIDGKIAFYGDLSGVEQEKRFAEMIEVSMTPEGSGLVVAAYADNRDDAIDFSRVAARTLTRFAGHYYNVNTEAEFRIIDGPKTAREMRDATLWIGTSIALGCGATGVFFFLILFVPELFTQRKRAMGEKSLFRPDVFEPRRPESAFSESNDIGRRTIVTDMSVSPVMVSAPSQVITKEAPPTNLPVATSPEEEAFLREFSFEGEEGVQSASMESDEPEEKKIENPLLAFEEGSEPTEEEYKRRLNELLRGNL